VDAVAPPGSLLGGAIPQPVRVLSVADVFDALASERPYRPALPQPKCLEMLEKNAAGGGLDPELVRLFCEAMAAAEVGSAR
jgi:putative two-component system response regulator